MCTLCILHGCSGFGLFDCCYDVIISGLGFGLGWRLTWLGLIVRLGWGCCVLLVCFGLIVMPCGEICLLVVVSYLFGFASLYLLLLEF